MPEIATASPAVLSWLTSLSELTRVRILRLLEGHELTVAEICAVLQLPQSTASRHLRVLANDGWARSRREGTSHFYRMDRGELEPAARRLWQLVRDGVDGGVDAEEEERRLRSVLAERQSRSQAFFATAAGRWDKVRRELFGERWGLLALAGLLPRGWTVGDLGCGTGQTAEALAPFVARVVAVDSSAPMLEAAGKRLAPLANVELRRGELEALPLDDGELDAAVLLLVLHHLSEPAAALAEVGRAVRPGGRVLIVDMCQHDRREYQQQMGHVWLGFGEEQMAGWLRQAGFPTARRRLLPPDPAASGPPLFAMSATREGSDPS